MKIKYYIIIVLVQFILVLTMGCAIVKINIDKKHLIPVKKEQKFNKMITYPNILETMPNICGRSNHGWKNKSITQLIKETDVNLPIK